MVIATYFFMCETNTTLLLTYFMNPCVKAKTNIEVCNWRKSSSLCKDGSHQLILMFCLMFVIQN